MAKLFEAPLGVNTVDIRKKITLLAKRVNKSKWFHLIIF